MQNMRYLAAPLKTTAPKNVLKLTNPEYLSERCCSLTFTSPKFPVSIDMRSVVNSKEVLLQWDSIARQFFMRYLWAMRAVPIWVDKVHDRDKIDQW